MNKSTKLEECLGRATLLSTTTYVFVMKKILWLSAKAESLTIFLDFVQS